MAKSDIIDEILEGLDTIRPIVLASKDKSTDLRSLLRRMLSLLETLQRTPSINPALYKKITDMLTMFFDAEHGALLKHLHHDDDNDAAWEKFDNHCKERKVLIDAALQDLPSALITIRRTYDLLGKEQPATDNLSENMINFEKSLRDYLQENAKVHREFSLLTSAFKNSVSAISDALGETGSDSEELKQAKLTLEQELPSNPEEARKVLRKAREDILKAGEKLSRATQQVRQTMSEQFEKMNQLSQKLEQAEAQARSDPLTGLGNRRKLREYFSTLPENVVSSFLMIDIDHFKQINDQYGHDAGDYVLEKLGYLLKVAIRSTDMVARLGGEEFCIVLPHANAEQAATLAESIRKEVSAENFHTKDGNIDVKVSIGVSERTPQEAITQWLKRADEALYQAKQGGRNQVVTAK